MTGLEPYSHEKKSTVSPAVMIVALIAVAGVLWVLSGSMNSPNTLSNGDPTLHLPTISTTESVGAQPGPEMIANENEANQTENENGSITPPSSGTTTPPLTEITETSLPAPTPEPTEDASSDAKLFIGATPNYSLSFCPQAQDVADQLRENIKPISYIKKSSQKVNLELWKELFIERNTITPDYFEKNIRISSAKVVPATSTSVAYFSVEYYLIVDWFNVKYASDVFALTNVEGKPLTENQIKLFFEKSWGDYSKPATVVGGVFTDYHFISNIRGNGSLFGKAVPCMDVIYAFHTIEQDMVPVEMQQNQTDHQLFINGYVHPKLDTNGNLIDLEQNCPYAQYNMITEQLQNKVYEASCPVA